MQTTFGKRSSPTRPSPSAGAAARARDVGSAQPVAKPSAPILSIVCVAAGLGLLVWSGFQPRQLQTLPTFAAILFCIVGLEGLARWGGRRRRSATAGESLFFAAILGALETSFDGNAACNDASSDAGGDCSGGDGGGGD